MLEVYIYFSHFMNTVKIIFAFGLSSVLMFSGCQNEPSAEHKTYTLAEVEKHNTQADCWTVVNGTVSDVTSFFGKHPGGDEALLKSCGKDATEMFESVKKHDPNGYEALERLSMGTLVE